MTTMDDMDLLREYVARESEQAFATLVSRHLDLVYSVALRHTGNPDHAQEITQAVFIILVRKATSLGPKTVLSGWLFNTTRLTARNFLRTEIRRTKREQETCMQSLAPESDENVWENVAPLLDQAVAGLGDKELASQPSVTLRWEKVTARAALNALLENQKLTMVINPATTVARIAPAKLDVKPVPAAQVGTDSNTIPLLTMENAPLLNVIKNLARQAGLNIAISPQVSAPDFSTQGFVTVRWEKITGRQALAAILDNYGLVMTEDAASSVAQITLK